MKITLKEKISIIISAEHKAEEMMHGLKSCEDQQGKIEYARQLSRFITLRDVLALLERNDSVCISI